MFRDSRARISNTIIDHVAGPASSSRPLRKRLENHLVGVLAAPQAEARAKVRLEIGLLLDRRNQRLVDLLLVLNALGIGVLLLGCGAALLEESILALALLLLACPVLVLAYAVEDLLVKVGNIDGCAGCDNVAVVYAAQGDAVGLEGTGDQENALRQLAEEDNALAGEASREEDEDCAGLEGVAVFGGVGGLARLLLLVCDTSISQPHKIAALLVRNLVAAFQLILARTFFMIASSSAG